MGSFLRSGIEGWSLFSIYCICPNHQDEMEILLCADLVPLASWKAMTSMRGLMAEQNLIF